MTLCEIAIAQPTLTASNINPVFGDTYTLYGLVAFADTLQNGPNVIWDYSSFVPTGIDTMVATSPVGSAVPSASIRYLFPTHNVSNYYNANQSKFEYAGYDNPSGINTYTDPETLLNFPFQYNDSFSDYLASHWPGPTQFRYGTVYSKADAYGTLILPNVTYTNVLRVKSNYYLKDSMSGIPATNYTYITLRWYAPGYHFPVASVMEYGNMVPPIFNYITGTPTTLTDLRVHGISVYPNPCINSLQIKTETEFKILKATIIDYSGRSVFKGESTQGKQFNMNTNNLASGFYILEIEVDNKKYRTKLMKG